jgi:hypothetical protein
VPDVQVVSAVVRLVVLPWRGLDADDVSGRSHASISQAAEGTILIVTVAAGELQHVEVAGSFSGWEPVALRRTGDGWEARIVLGSGRHRVAVRLDGGPRLAGREMLVTSTAPQNNQAVIELPRNSSSVVSETR